MNNLVNILNTKFNKNISDTTEIDIEDIPEEKKSSYFEVINNLFNEKYWKNLTNNDKSRAYFILNRFMSINFPMQSALLSQIGIKTDVITEFWKRILNKQYSKMPNWFYVKTSVKNKNKTKTKQKSIKDFPNEILQSWMTLNKCGITELSEINRLFPEELYKELNLLKDLNK
jgi:hypothetical protein